MHLDSHGHMTTTAFYSFYNAIENKNNKVLLLFFGGLVVSILGQDIIKNVITLHKL